MIVEILNQVDTITQEFVFNGYQGLVSAYKPAIFGLVILAIIVFGYALLHGFVEMSMAELGKRILLIGFVLTFALNWGTFSSYVYDLCTKAPNQIATTLLQSIPNTPFHDQGGVNLALDKYWDSSMFIASQTFAKGGISHWSPFLIGFLMILLTFILAGIALVELIMAKFGLAIFMVLAPLIIPTLLFKATKEALFDGWVKHLITFALIPIFITAGLALGLLLMASVMNNLDSMVEAGTIPTMQQVAPYMLYSIATIGLLMKASVMAVSMAGGFALSMAAGTAALATRFYKKGKDKFIPKGDNAKPSNTPQSTNEPREESKT